MVAFTVLQTVVETVSKAAHNWHLDKIDKWTLISSMTLVVAWAILRPNMVRDFDNRPLPYNSTARIFVVLGYCVVFLSLSMMFVMIDGAADYIANLQPMLSQMLKIFDQPPFLAAVAIFFIPRLPFFSEVERTSIVWAHGRRQIFDDQRVLTEHLERGPFDPSPAEQKKNREFVRPYGLYLTDDTFDNPGLVGFNKWRKTSTLVRLVREWNDNDDSRVLSAEDMKLLEDIETAHTRKTELAVNIIRSVNEAAQGGEASKALAQMVKVLGETPHIDRASVAAAEARAKMILSASGEDHAKPMRLSNEQLKANLGHIERYFHVEYQLLLEHSAAMAAKSVVHSGDLAADRLEQLETAGVGGLGRIQPYDLNHVLWAGMGVFLFGFLIMYMGNFPTMTPAQAEGLARFALAMSFASLIGAALGSRRRWARARTTQWWRYMAWGVVAGAAFLGLSAVWVPIKTALGIPVVPGAATLPFSRLVPWALLPCATVIVIARLARMQHWPWVRSLQKFRGTYVRVLDGLSVSLAIYVAYCLAIALHPLFQLDLPPSVARMMADPHRLPIPINWTLQVMAFMIGAMVLRDVRWAAHSTIVMQDDAGEAERAAVEKSGNKKAAQPGVGGGGPYIPDADAATKSGPSTAQATAKAAPPALTVVPTAQQPGEPAPAPDGVGTRVA